MTGHLERPGGWALPLLPPPPPEPHPSLWPLAEPLGGVKNLQVTDPTINSLRVRWEPAEGDVRQYQVLYVPAAGGTESMVRPPTHPH